MTEPTGLKLELLNTFASPYGGCAHFIAWSQLSYEAQRKTPHPPMVSVHCRNLCGDCSYKYAQLLVQTSSPHTETLKEVSMSLKYIVAFLDKLDLSCMAFRRDESKEPLSADKK